MFILSVFIKMIIPNKTYRTLNDDIINLRHTAFLFKNKDLSFILNALIKMMTQRKRYRTQNHDAINL